MTTSKESNFTPGPRTVPTASLQANPHNPRLLFDEDDLITLKESIDKKGILVPLVVFKGTGSKKYTILDGQRRWICATALKLPSVPINVVREPSTVENIVTMFQIHKLRKDWELMPTALKLSVLMKEMGEKRERQLAELTGLDAAVVSRCKKLLSFSPKYQNMMLFKEPGDRIKADFFIELYPVLHDSILTKASWYNRNKIIDVFLRKYQERLSGFRSLTDFRKIKQYLSNARASGHDKQILKKFKLFLESDNLDIATLEVDAARIHRLASRIANDVNKVFESIRELPVDEYIAEEELWQDLEKLMRMIRKKLSEADRRES